MATAQPATTYAKPLNATAFIAAVAGGQNNAGGKRLSLISDTDQLIRQIIVPRVANLRFEVDGIPFQAQHTPNGNTAQLTIWCMLGYLPYSVTSADKRRNLITILEGSHQMPHVRLGIDDHMTIIASGVYTIPNPPTPIYLFEPLTRFLQESRPFIRLIAEYL